MIIFDIKIEPVDNVAAFCPDFSDFKKPETVAAKREEWLKEGWKKEPLACRIAHIAVPSADTTADKLIEATPDAVVKFVAAVCSGKDAVVCDGFFHISAQLLVSLLRVPSTTPGRDAAVKALYDLRRRQLSAVFTHLADKDIDTVYHVHNPIRAMRLDDMSTAQLCAFLGIQPTSTRLTILKEMAHLMGITP